MFDESSADFDAELDGFMRKEYPSWDNLNSRSKLREAGRAVLEGVETGETTKFKKGIFSHIQRFLDYTKTLFSSDKAISAYLNGVQAKLDAAQKRAQGPQPEVFTIKELDDTGRESFDREMPPAEAVSMLEERDRALKELRECLGKP
jgi:hypothetical protein